MKNKRGYENWLAHALEFDMYYEKLSPYNWIRRRGLQFRMQTALRLIGNPQGMCILDIGCGTGRLLIELAKKGAEVWGIELSKEALSVAKKNAEEAGVTSRTHFLQGDICQENTPIPNADVWVALGLIEYIPSPHAVLNRVRRIPRFIFSVPKQISWEIPFRLINRTLLKTTKFYAYRKKQVLDMLRQVGYDEADFISYFGAGDVVHNCEEKPIHSNS